MLTQRVLSDLSRRLSEPIASEEEVLYVLVAARKLLELEGSGTAVDAARFICDWAVHSVIDRNSWSRKSLVFLDRVFGSWESWEHLSPEDQSRLRELVSLEAIRGQLMDVFRRHRIAPIALGHAEGWVLFLQKFVSLVGGCPLRLAGGQFIEEAEVSMRPSDGHQRLFDVVWNFKRTGSGGVIELPLPIFVNPADFHFGRNGRAVDQAFENKLRVLGLDFRVAAPGPDPI